jgi:hypothetical protein
VTLEEYIDSLPEAKRYRLATKFANLTLLIWNKYADEHELVYRDSVVGMSHVVDRNLLSDTIAAVEVYMGRKRLVRSLLGKAQLLHLHHQFTDPIVALQDDDWPLPDSVVKVFYSINNLLEAAMGREQTAFGNSTISVAINQAIDALQTSMTFSTSEIRELLKKVD